MQIDGSNERHIQVSFFTKNKKEVSIPDDVFDVPTTADSENLNALVNQSIKQNEDDWTDTKFELLIGETFLRSTLNEFIEEYSIDTEHVVKIECILGLEPPKPLFDLPAPDWISSVHSFNKHVLATTFNGEILVWDRKGKKIAQISKDSGTAYKCSEIITSPKGDAIDGLTLAVSGEKPIISILEFRGKMATTLQQLRGHERSVSSIAINKDKTRLISGAFDSHLKVWNLQESADSIGKPTESNDKSKRKKENFVTKVPMVTLGGHKDAVVAVKWCTWNDAHCVSASWDHSIAVWDLELAGEISRMRHSKAFTSIDVHQTTGLVISGSADSIPRLFDTRSTEGSLVKQSFIGHTGWISSVKWHYAQPNVFISGSFDSVVKLWDIRSSKTSLYDLHGHTDRVMCVASGDDATILSGGADSTVKFFGQ